MRKYIVIALCLIILSAVSVLIAFNYRVVLITSGIQETYVLHEGNSPGVIRPYRVIFSQGGRNGPQIAKLTRNFGIWSVEQRADPNSSPFVFGVLLFNWTEMTSIPENAHGRYLYHVIYYNHTAPEEIHINYELLPPGMNVNILKLSDAYILHFTTFNSDELEYIGFLGGVPSFAESLINDFIQ